DPDGGPWSVDVNWGDSTAHTVFPQSSPGTITPQSHTYGEEGTYTVTVKVTDGLNLSGSATFQVAVSDPAVLATGVGVSAKEPFASPATVATYPDPGGAEPNPSDPTDGIPSHYTATIDWGDLTPPSAGTITFSGTPGSKTDPFTVTGTHTFAEEGT